MSNLMSKIDEFVEKNNMSESAKKEMIDILNESLLEISKGIMENNRNSNDKKKEIIVEKRFKSRKAEDYAKEHGLSLEDFSINEVSKKDVEIMVRDLTKKDNNPISKNKLSEVKNVEKTVEKKKEKVICSGINKKGEACKSVGTIMPDGAKKKYCFRHAEDFRSFECESDSSNEDSEPYETCKPCLKTECLVDSDSELFEEN